MRFDTPTLKSAKRFFGNRMNEAHFKSHENRIDIKGIGY